MTTPTTGHNSGVTPGELKQIVEQVEHLEAERADLNEQVKAVLSHAKSSGFNTKVIRKVIALRKRAPDDVAEEEAITELYKSALGMQP